MKRPYKIVISLMAMPALAAGVSACSASGGGQQPGISSANSIITAYTTEPQTRLTPGTTNENGGYRVLTMLYSRLVSFDLQGKAHNEVAQSIRAEKNNRRYTIKLKKGWKFSDGTPVTASSFTRSWSYTANSANGQLTSSFFSIIKGYGDLQKKEISAHAQLSGLKVVDKTTFTVDLTQPSQAFPVMVGYTAFSPLPQSFFANPREFGEHPVGNGPYKFKSWTHNKQIEIIKNPYYKGNFTVKNGGITFKIYTDPSSAYSDVEAGNLDVMDTVPVSALRTFQTDTTIKAYNKAGATTFGLRFAAGLKHFGTTTEGILRRKAVSLAINREKLTTKILAGAATAATDFIAPGIPGHSSSIDRDKILSYNPVKARKLWAQANAISPWSSSDTIILSYNSDSGNKEVFDALANQLKNVLSVSVQTDPIATSSQFSDQIDKRTLKTIYKAGWIPDYPAAENYLKPLYSTSAAHGNGSNYSDYQNPHFDRLIDQAALAKTTSKSIEFYQQAEKILLQQLPVVPLYYVNNYGVCTAGIGGFVIEWDAIPPYYQLTK